jgi:hypothetical protein
LRGHGLFDGYTIVQGDPGEGKTTVILAIAAAVTKGEALPNGARDEPANVLFQSAEDGLTDTIKPRLEALGADCSRMHFIDENEKSLSLSDERIEQAIMEKNARLLILDPIQAYLGGSDMHSVNGVRPLMQRLAKVAENTDCAIVLIGHLNKGKGKSAYRGLGSIDVYAAARSVLVVGRLSETERVVAQAKSNLAPIGKAVAFELDPVLGFEWRGECDADVDDVMSGKANKPENQFSKARKIIEEFLSDGYEVKAADIYERAENEGISIKTLKRAKAELGVITFKRADGWYWQLPVIADFTKVGCDGFQGGQGGQKNEVFPLSPLNQNQFTARKELNL